MTPLRTLSLRTLPLRVGRTLRTRRCLVSAIVLFVALHVVFLVPPLLRRAGAHWFAHSASDSNGDADAELVDSDTQRSNLKLPLQLNAGKTTNVTHNRLYGHRSVFPTRPNIFKWHLYLVLGVIDCSSVINAADLLWYNFIYLQLWQ